MRPFNVPNESHSSIKLLVDSAITSYRLIAVVMAVPHSRLNVGPPSRLWKLMGGAENRKIRPPVIFASIHLFAFGMEPVGLSTLSGQSNATQQLHELL
jgi:hypothetical protein